MKITHDCVVGMQQKSKEHDAIRLHHREKLQTGCFGCPPQRLDDWTKTAIHRRPKHGNLRLIQI